jgi:hypothetical protein
VNSRSWGSRSAPAQSGAIAGAVRRGRPARRGARSCATTRVSSGRRTCSRCPRSRSARGTSCSSSATTAARSSTAGSLPTRRRRGCGSSSSRQRRGNAPRGTWCVIGTPSTGATSWPAPGGWASRPSSRRSGPRRPTPSPSGSSAPSGRSAWTSCWSSVSGTCRPCSGSPRRAPTPRSWTKAARTEASAARAAGATIWLSPFLVGVSQPDSTRPSRLPSGGRDAFVTGPH